MIIKIEDLEIVIGFLCVVVVAYVTIDYIINVFQL